MKKYSSYFNKKYAGNHNNDSMEQTDLNTETPAEGTASEDADIPVQQAAFAPEPERPETQPEPFSESVIDVSFEAQAEPEPLETPTAPVELAETMESEMPVENEATIISKSAVINGELSVNGDVHMFGKIKGNLTAHGNLEIAGKVVGNVTGNDVELNRCELKGDVNAKGFVFMDKDSIMVGNVASQDITLDGKVKGDVIASHKVYIRSNAIIIGNVKAAMIAIDEGAALQGQVIISNKDGQPLNIAEETPAK